MTEYYLKYFVSWLDVQVHVCVCVRVDMRVCKERCYAQMSRNLHSSAQRFCVNGLFSKQIEQFVVGVECVAEYKWHRTLFLGKNLESNIVNIE